MYIGITESLGCRAEINIVNQLCFNEILSLKNHKKFFKKISVEQTVDLNYAEKEIKIPVLQLIN